MATEIRKNFHDDLDALIADVIALGDMAIKSVEEGTDAFLNGDVKEAEAVVEGDKLLDSLMISIEMRACELLARQNPMATDLRTLVTVLRVIHDLERCGDYMVNIAKATRRIYPHTLQPESRELVSRDAQAGGGSTIGGHQGLRRQGPRHGYCFGRYG